MIEKASGIAAQGGAGVAVVSGVEMVFGFTPGQWSAIGVIGGLLIGIVGLLVNAYFQWRRTP